MNILFIYSVQNAIRRKYPLKGQEDIQMGISYISAVLKNNGHTTNLLVPDRKSRNYNFRTIHSKIDQCSPTLICFTSVNSEIDFIIDLAREVKKEYPDIFLLLGGVHVTLNPDEKLLEIFDAICIGEGEYPTLELVVNLEHGKAITGIKNLWVKSGGNIIKNLVRPFIQDLDELPFADREIWQEWILEPGSRQAILAGRGCPYNCTYCCNHKLRKTAPGKYVRLRQPGKIVEELELIVEKYRNSEIFLEIETLGTNPGWLAELCMALKAYNDSRPGKASFSANLRIYPGMDTDFVFSLLSQAGFTSVTIGLESGSERIRREVLNRDYSNHDIRKAVTSARKFGISIGIFNLVGLPSETPADFAETLRMNREIQPEWHATSIFYPYEGTELYDLVKNQGLIAGKLNPRHERQIARIDYPQFSKKRIQKSFDSFHYDVYRKSKKKSILKLALFFLQRYIGHHAMAKSKNLLINILSRIKLKSGTLLTIFQKS